MLWAPAAPAQLAEAGPAALDRAGLPDAASWWALPGRPLWLPEAAAGLAPPASFAGLARGGWRLVEPGRAPAELPWPGVARARAALAWYDSLARGPGGAARGWDAAVEDVTGAPPVGGTPARSAFSMAGGSAALDETAVTLARGDSAFGLGLDALSGTRGALAGVERSGRHLWGARARLARGAHRFRAAFAQRGTATRLASDEEQAARGRSGAAEWRWTRGETRWSADLARGLDNHESFGGGLIASDRAAQETRLGAGFGLSRGGRDLDARLAWSSAEVRRQGFRSFARRAQALWASASGGAPLAGGRLALSLGAGHHEGVDRFDVAPGVEFARPLGALRTAVRLERLLTPVWADLAAGAEPFLQHAWVAGADVAAGDAGAWRARAGLRGGRVHSRALVDRLPLEELWLRSGVREQLGTYDFLLAEGGLERAGRGADAGLEGFALARRRGGGDRTTTGGPVVEADPAAGFRAWLGGRRHFFGGDLGLGLRAEAAGVGAREAGTAVVRRLPAYVTFSLLGEVSLADVTVVWRLRNLEDRPRDGAWVDRSTGLPVVEGGRELQMRLVWRLFN